MSNLNLVTVGEDAVGNLVVQIDGVRLTRVTEISASLVFPAEPGPRGFSRFEGECDVTVTFRARVKDPAFEEPSCE